MKHESQTEKISKRSLFAAAVVGAFFIILGLLPENGWWGINHLYFLPVGFRVFFALSIIVVLSSLIRMPKRFQKFIVRFLSGPSRTTHYMWLILFAVLLIWLRVAVHSLGDGYQRATEIESGFILKSTEMLDFFTHAMLYKVLQLFGSFRATTAMAVTSIAAGVVFIHILIKQSPYSDWKNGLFFWSVFAMGSSQLFFGYVESYALVYLFGIWYLLLAFRPSGADAKLWYLTLIYLLAGFSHVIGMILMPSLMLLSYRRIKTSSRRLQLIVFFLLLSISPLLIPLLIGTFTFAGEERQLTDYFLPLFDGTYGIFSPGHLFDILNQFLLVGPIFFMALFFVREAFKFRGYRSLALSIIIPALCFIVVIDPELSMVRDWDLFALPVALCIVPFLILTLQSIKEYHRHTAMRLTAVIVTSLLLMFSWVFLNSDRDSHLQRTEYILDHSRKSQRYGYELLAYYYSTHQDYTSELRTLERIKPEERTARVYGKLSQAYYALGRFDEAYRLAQHGAKMPDPVRLNAIMAGITAYDRSEYLKAIYYLRIAVDMDPNDSQWFCKLGMAYAKIDSVEAASAAYKQALTRDPSLACSYFGMAHLFYQNGEYEKAAQYCGEGLRRDPNSAEGRQLLNMIQKSK